KRLRYQPSISRYSASRDSTNAGTALRALAMCRSPTGLCSLPMLIRLRRRNTRIVRQLQLPPQRIPCLALLVDRPNNRLLDLLSHTARGDQRLTIRAPLKFQNLD